VKSDDTLAALAVRFFTTVERLLEVNPDIATRSGIRTPYSRAGVCVCVCACLPADGHKRCVSASRDLTHTCSVLPSLSLNFPTPTCTQLHFLAPFCLPGDSTLPPQDLGPSNVVTSSSLPADISIWLTPGDVLCVVPPVCDVRCDSGSICSLSDGGRATSGLLA
jgi:hypothetical protein